MIELHGKKYQRIGGLWHFYYLLKSGVEWHIVLNYAIKRELKAAEHRLHLDVGDSPAQKDLFTLEAGSAAGKSPTPAPIQ